MIKLDSRQKRSEYLDKIVCSDKDRPTVVVAERKFSNRTATTIDFSSDFLYRHIKMFCSLKDPYKEFSLISGTTFYYFINDAGIFQEMVKLCHGASNFNLVPKFCQLVGDRFRLGLNVVVKQIQSSTDTIGTCCCGGVVLSDSSLFKDIEARMISRFMSSPQAGRIGLLHII